MDLGQAFLFQKEFETTHATIITGHIRIIADFRSSKYVYKSFYQAKLGNNQLRMVDYFQSIQKCLVSFWILIDTVRNCWREKGKFFKMRGKIAAFMLHNLINYLTLRAIICQIAISCPSENAYFCLPQFKSYFSQDFFHHVKIEPQIKSLAYGQFGPLCDGDSK